MRAILFTLFGCSIAVSAFSQQLEVRNILINGLKVTKYNTVIRELSFQKGDTIYLEDLAKIFKKNKSNLQNQWLFNFVEFIPIIEEDKIDVFINVTERWYVWPYPVFEIAERNFNVFWDSLKQSNYKDFSKLNYGVFLNWHNFRGRNELLKIKFRKGYKEHYLFEYNIPYINKRKTWGIALKTELFRMQQFYYNTINHQLIYTQENTNLLKDKKLSFSIQYKPKINIVHKIELEATKMEINQITDNADFLYNNDEIFKFIRLEYLFTQEKRDYKSFPLDGSMNQVCIEYYHGLENKYKNINLILKTENHNKFDTKWSIGNSIKVKSSLRQDVPYVLNSGFGFEDYLRGYEYYVIDGTHFVMSKTAIKHILLSKKTITLPAIPWEEFNKTHVSIYFSIFADMGYVYSSKSKNNSLNNEFLMSQGASIDMVTYYDKILRFEVSRNHLNEIGFFIHFSSPFGENLKSK